MSNIRVALLLATAAALFLSTAFSTAQSQQAYSTKEEAIGALVTAAKAGDRAGLIRILGRGGDDIISSGDPVADTAARQAFTSAFDAKHQIMMDGDNKGMLLIGTNEYPFPIPLVRKNDKWSFDTAAGRLEILYRRIGRNELNAIQASLAYVDAQNEYAEKDRGLGTGVYARRFLSSKGKKDGLYWPTGQGEDESPLGDLVADASNDGYRLTGRRTPYHGYYYKILTRQGPTAPGGPADYIVGGKMIGGFALLAWPAEYGNSGVMTFLVNHAGEVFEKDRGPRSGWLADRTNAFNPDQTWRKVGVDFR